VTQIRWGGKWVHFAYIWIVSHFSAKNYRNLWKFDEVLTKTNLLSFLGHGVVGPTLAHSPQLNPQKNSKSRPNPTRRSSRPVDNCDLAGWVNSITGQTLSICVCVRVLTRVAHVITAAVDTCDPACTDLLINFDHRRITRSVWPSWLGL